MSLLRAVVACVLYRSDAYAIAIAAAEREAAARKQAGEQLSFVKPQ